MLRVGEVDWKGGACATAKEEGERRGGDLLLPCW